jgi:hypothetical protein
MISYLAKKYSILIIILAGTILFPSCNKSAPSRKKPDNLIQRDSIPSIMLDVYIAESALYIKSQRGIDLGLYTTVYYNSLFKKHSVTRKQFMESLSFYLETDNNASSLFLDVINHLVSLQKPSSAKPEKEENPSEKQVDVSTDQNAPSENPLLKKKK